MATMLAPGSSVTVEGVTYEVVRLLKSGGYGSVFLAEYTSKAGFPKFAALKVPTRFPDGVERARFVREARILAGIRHPNVARFLGFEALSCGQLIIAQEFVDGSSVFEFCAANEDAFPSIVLQILEGLAAFHEHSAPTPVVHRDISPNNILVDRRGVVRIIDFGFAKEDPRLTTMLTSPLETFGTPGCTAPEQLFCAANVDHRADLYSLGKTLGAIIQMRSPMHVDFSTIPPPWREFVKKLAAHEPADRFQDARTAYSAALDIIADRQLTLEPAAWRYQPENRERWFRIFAAWISATVLFDQDVVQTLSELPEQFWATHPRIAKDVYSRLSESDFFQERLRGRGSYESSDAFGDLLTNLYPHLGKKARRSCFQATVNLAIVFNRYAVMDRVRKQYSIERDIDQQRRLVQTLAQEDPRRVIEGRGVIPIEAAESA